MAIIASKYSTPGSLGLSSYGTYTPNIRQNRARVQWDNCCGGYTRKSHRFILSFKNNHLWWLFLNDKIDNGSYRRAISAATAGRARLAFSMRRMASVRFSAELANEMRT